MPEYLRLEQNKENKYCYRLSAGISKSGWATSAEEEAKTTVDGVQIFVKARWKWMLK